MATIFNGIYVILFNLIYPTLWFSSLWFFRLSFRLIGKELSRKYTDTWATGWGVGQLLGSFFFHRAKIKMTVDPKIHTYKGPFLVMMNHQTTYDIAVAFYVMWSLGRNVRWVLKKELLKAPVIGAACREMRCAFLNRKDRAEATQELQRFANQIREDQVSAMIFVEGTRATPDKLQNSEFSHVLNPKPLGISILQNELKDWPLLSVTIDWHNTQGSTIFGTAIWKAVLHIDAKMYQPEELGDDIGQWLQEQEWPRYDKIIENWRQAQAKQVEGRLEHTAG